MFKSHLQDFCNRAVGSAVEPHIDVIKNITNRVIDNINQGDLHRWMAAYGSLPDLTAGKIDYDKPAVKVQFDPELSESVNLELKDTLLQLHPWRKGPFQIGDTFVDAEWRSNLKWERLLKALPELTGRTVLDIGCGNGYYLMKMAKYNPRLLLGIEPGLLQNIQFWSIEKFAKTGGFVLPLKIQEMPLDMKCFDVVFSMGVLYHRKSPIEHIEHLKSLLSPQGTLVLETLIVDGDEQTCLVPPGRYAQMRNVWFLPSVSMLSGWLEKVGFKNVEIADVSITTTEEQRSTDWMRFHSLPQFLTADQQQTVEGHPPPKRVIISCS
ncbi:MAG: tRNA 5-methoxyuridine(34)/uridine 5-oxyacetic acid(34) synthase CmoB [Xanthomonadales bacterium]|nr:tRNA 5-methoxyuridine(34)/uridine 5-oxyacetic acid(34) synthase CmoB [Xanthomonadales bacterium]